MYLSQKHTNPLIFCNLTPQNIFHEKIAGNLNVTSQRSFQLERKYILYCKHLGSIIFKEKIDIHIRFPKKKSISKGDVMGANVIPIVSPI
jgi:hypothetical protein